jgi:hypothetical protein
LFSRDPAPAETQLASKAHRHCPSRLRTRRGPSKQRPQSTNKGATERNAHRQAKRFTGRRDRRVVPERCSEPTQPCADATHPCAKPTRPMCRTNPALCRTNPADAQKQPNQPTRSHACSNGLARMGRGLASVCGVRLRVCGGSLWKASVNCGVSPHKPEQLLMQGDAVRWQHRSPTRTPLGRVMPPCAPHGDLSAVALWAVTGRLAEWMGEPIHTLAQQGGLGLGETKF